MVYETICIVLRSIPDACAAGFILGKDNVPPFSYSTQMDLGTNFTGEVYSDRLTSCPKDVESHLSAKCHRNRRLALTLPYVHSDFMKDIFF